MTKILCWVGVHRWSPWRRLTVGVSNEDGWSPYEGRRCERCNWGRWRVHAGTDTP